MTGVRKVRFDHLIGVYAVGSGDWSWRDEYEKLIDRPVTQQLIESIRSEGIREPVLLGKDGRVWDGHHRIIVAMHLGLDTVPIEFSGAVAEEPEGGRWFTPAYRATSGNIIAFGDETVVQEHAQRYVDQFTAEDPEGPDYFVATRILPPWVSVKQEGAET